MLIYFMCVQHNVDQTLSTRCYRTGDNMTQILLLAKDFNRHIKMDRNGPDLMCMLELVPEHASTTFAASDKSVHSSTSRRRDN